MLQLIMRPDIGRAQQDERNDQDNDEKNPGHRQGFVYLSMGYASAMAWILFIIILVVTFILLRTSNVWTHYEL